MSGGADGALGRRIGWIVACALFMQSLDATAITTAIPAMALSLDVSPLTLSGAVTAYVLAIAIALPLSAWATERFGTRRIFVGAILLFTGASVACGLAVNIDMLIVARIVQGLGGAMMVPSGRLLLLQNVPRAELVSAMVRVSTPALLGPALGPIGAGILVEYASWRWIFLINIPFGLIAATLVLRLPLADERPDRPAPFDRRGFLLSGAALGMIIYGVDALGRAGVSPETIVLLLAAGTALGVLYILHSRTCANPVLDLRIFRIPSFAAGVGGGALFRIGMGAIPFLVPLMLQVGFGASPVMSGAVTVATAIGAISTKPLARHLLRRFGFRALLAGNVLLSSAMLASYGLFQPTTPLIWIFAALLIGGMLRSLQFTGLNSLAFADIPAERLGSANTLSSVVQQLSISFGVALSAAILYQRHSVGEALTAGDFFAPFAVVGLLGALSALWFWRLPPTSGADVSGHRPRPAQW